MDPSVEAEVREFWDSYDVEEDVQDSLITALGAGQQWDALAGGDPTSVETHAEDGFDVTVATYPDGSIAVQELQQAVPASSGMAPQQITQCTVRSTSTLQEFDDCFVSNNVGIASASFRVDYTWYRSGRSVINSYHSPARHYIGANAGEPTLTAIRTQSSGSLPAEVRLSFTASTVVPVATWTCWLEFYSYGNGTRDSQSFF